MKIKTVKKVKGYLFVQGIALFVVAIGIPMTCYIMNLLNVNADADSLRPFNLFCIVGAIVCFGGWVVCKIYLNRKPIDRDQ